MAKQILRDLNYDEINFATSFRDELFIARICTWVNLYIQDVFSAASHKYWEKSPVTLIFVRAF